MRKNGERYGQFKTLAQALYERDRLIAVNWDVEDWLELPDTINGYIHIDLPPFKYTANYITMEREHWQVRSRGDKYRYYGTYYSEEEAKEVAMIYNGRITHHRMRYRVQKKIGKKMVYFGKYKTLEEAKERVEELKENGWIK